MGVVDICLVLCKICMSFQKNRSHNGEDFGKK